MENKKIRVPIIGIFYAVIFLIAVMNIPVFLNSNLLIHIKTGEWMIDNARIIQKDIFSFTGINEWVNYYWLSDLIYGYIYRYAGIGTILIMNNMMICFSFIIMAFFLYKKNVNIFILGLALLMGVYASMPQWIVIPYTFNFLFIASMIYMMDKYYIDGEKKYLILIVILQIFWVNMNSEFFYTLIIILLYMIADIVGVIKKEENAKKGIKRNLILVALIVPIFFLNPYGAEEIAKVFSNYIFMIKDRANDWASPNFHGFAKSINVFLAFSVFIIITFKKDNLQKERRYIYIYLISIFSFLYAQRNMLVFVIVSVMFIPLFITQNNLIKNKSIKTLFDKMEKWSENSYKSLSGVFLNVFLIVVITLIFLINVRGMESSFNKIMESWARSSGVKYIKDNKIEGKGFHQDSQGDMIIWYLSPNTKVFIDTRAGNYSWKHMNEYSKILLANEGWEKIIEKNNINWILINKNQFSNILNMQKEKWVIVYESRVSVLFLKKDYYEKIKNRIKIEKE